MMLVDVSGPLVCVGETIRETGKGGGGCRPRQWRGSSRYGRTTGKVRVWSVCSREYIRSRCVARHEHQKARGSLRNSLAGRSGTEGGWYASGSVAAIRFERAGRVERRGVRPAKRWLRRALIVGGKKESGRL